VKARSNRSRGARELLKMGLILGSLALGVSLSGALERIDHFVWDLAQRQVAPQRPEGVVLVAVDPASLAVLGRWPWPRRVHAQLLDQICRAEPRAVVMNIAFNEVGDDPAADQVLAQAMQNCGKVVLPMMIERASLDGQLLESPPIGDLAESAAGLGRIGLRPDLDGVTRRVNLWAGVGTPAWPLLAQTALQVGGWKAPADAAYRPQEESLEPPEDPYGVAHREPRLLRFIGPPGTVPTLSAADLLQSSAPAEALRGKIVLIGATAAGLGDFRHTPVSTDGAMMAGVEVLATTLLNLRDDRFITPLDTSWALALTLLLALVPLLWSSGLMPRATLALNVLWIGAVGALAMLLPLCFGLWFAPAGVLVAAVAANPLWSWRRLETARRHLDWQIKQLAELTDESSFRRLGFEQRISHVQQAQRRFLELQTQREETLTFLTHDIRAPLAEAVRQLEEGPLDADGQRVLFKQLRRAHRLAYTFLSLARLQGLEPKQIREIDLGALVHQATDAVYDLAHASALRLERDIPDDPVWIRGNFDLLERAVGNLLQNALRFAPAGSTIRVALTATREDVEVAVSDQGPGVSAEMLPHLFQRFSPQHTSERHEHSTGLGLYFAQTVASKHGGSATYEAVQPSGARFAIRLPSP
jgi:CHASE2 domain-containing sensor protein/nitrogen-specific signal transduction histidine kinase